MENGQPGELHRFRPRFLSEDKPFPRPACREEGPPLPQPLVTPDERNLEIHLVTKNITNLPELGLVREVHGWDQGAVGQQRHRQPV